MGLHIRDANIEMLLDLARIGPVPMAPKGADGAPDAFKRHGKGTGNPADLNIGACFAYAVARNRGVPLPYEGEDFALADLGDP